MLKQVIETIKSLVYGLLRLVKDPVRDYGMQLTVKKQQFKKGFEALASSKAQVKLIDDELVRIEKEIKDAETDITSAKSKDEASISAITLINLRQRKDILTKSKESSDLAIVRAEEQLKDLGVSIKNMEANLRTYEF